MEFIEILHRDDFLASPVASNKSHPNISKGPENVLPLFDDEISGTGAGKSNTQTDRVATAKPQVRFAPETQSEQRVNTTFGDPDVNGSFIPSVESGHDDDPRDPHALNADSRRYESGVRAASNATPSMLDPSLRLAPVSESENVDRRLKPQLGKTRKASHKKKLKVVNSSNNEARPLADILRLSDGVEANRPGVKFTLAPIGTMTMFGMHLC
ncbi:hypothetical protein GQ600_11264 [Phytophthora cactorum]|nr:hypothetical protein GQ600_11264 [Phytophthora cactorum]